MAKIKTLKDPKEGFFYPITSTKAVVDDNGNSVDVMITDTHTLIENLESNTGVSEYPTFDETKTYAVGDVVLFEGKMYRFTSAHEAGAWDGSQVEDWSERKEHEDKITTLQNQVLTLNQQVYTDNPDANQVIRKLYIDTSGYTGSNNLNGLKIRAISRGNNGLWGLAINNSADELIAAFWVRNELPVIDVVDTGVRMYGEFYWEEMAELSRITRGTFTPLAFSPLNDKTEIPPATQVATEVVNESLLFGDYNYIQDSTKIAGGFVNLSDSVVTDSSFDHYKMPVTIGDTLKITATAGQLARLWRLYDVDNKILAYSTDASTVGDKEEVVIISNDRASYIVVNARNFSSSVTPSIRKSVDKLAAEHVFVSEGETILDFIYKQQQESLADSGNILAGKILCCVGDSITFGADMDDAGKADSSELEMYQWSGTTWTKKTSDYLKTYGFQIAERNKMIFYNGGVSGSTMQGLTNKSGFSLPNGRYTQLPENIDYLTIFFGWNDHAYGTLGSITDTTNETYYGGFNVVMPYLIEKYPYAKIALIVPFGTSAEHREAVRKLANKWGVACFDFYKEGAPLIYGKEDSVAVDSSIVAANRTKFFYKSGPHPLYRGHSQIAAMLENFLRGI